RPGVYRCAPDVYRIPLPLPMDGLRAVNVYAIRHGDEITVIDAGWSIPEARDVLAAALAELDAGFGDVRRFLVTINDPDQPEGPIMAARLRRAGAEAVLAKLSGLRSPHLDMSDWALPDD